MEYDFEIVHHPDKQHQAADALSSLPKSLLTLDTVAADINDDIPAYCNVGQVMEVLDGTDLDTIKENRCRLQWKPWRRKPKIYCVRT